MKTGDIIDGYEILDHIDSGGMGSVYLASKGEYCYALKTCLEKDPEYIKRFKREVRLMKSVVNPYVIEVFDENLDIDDPYFVMPLCDSSLSEMVRKGLTDDEKFDFTKQLCIGVKSLHDSKIIHRDIKPNNTLVLNNEIKVSDLGLGKFINRDSTVLTPTIATLGTPEYMSPEIYRDGDGRNADERSDIYSIGKLLYFVFSDGESPQYIDASKVKPDIYSIINKCIKMSPTDRYQDVSRVINALNVCQKARAEIISMSDIISTYKLGVNNAEFAKKAYNYLLNNQDDLASLIETLRILKSDKLALILKYNSEGVSTLIHLLLTTHQNNSSYWIQFEDVDILVDIARILLQTTKVLQEKQNLLEFAIILSIGYNRWTSMQIVISMLYDLTEKDIKSIAPFLNDNKENINIIKDATKKTLPEAVKIFIQ